MNHYGSSFGNESMQTSMPSCMSKLHRNYSWASKAVSGSEVCNRPSVCSVFNRMSSNIAKVDRYFWMHTHVIGFTMLQHKKSMPSQMTAIECDPILMKHCGVSYCTPHKQTMY